jgi:hypothetical protein
MAININYTPVGALSALATGAGQAQAQRTGFSQDMQLMNFAQGQQASAEQALLQSRQLQNAHQALMDRMSVQSTPVSDHIQERATLADQQRVQKQAAFKTQLDTMLQNGNITPDQYAKGQLAFLAGNETMMSQVMAAPKPVHEKPNITNAEEVDIIRSPFREQRKPLETQLQVLQKQQADPTTVTLGNASKYQAQIDQIQGQINDLYTKERDAIDTWRKGGPASLKAPAAPAPVGSYSMQRVPNESEQNIINLLAAKGITLPSFQQQTGTAGKQITPELVAQLKQQFGADKEAARQWLRANGYEGI